MGTTGHSSLARFGLVWGIVSAITLLSGCDALGKKDVTNDPAYGNFSTVVGTWKTKSPLWLILTQETLYLSTRSELYSGMRQIAVLPAGTEIRIQRLVSRKTFDYDYLDPMGSIASGPLAGKAVQLDEALFVPNQFKHRGATTQPAGGWQKAWAVAPDKLEK